MTSNDVFAVFTFEALQLVLLLLALPPKNDDDDEKRPDNKPILRKKAFKHGTVTNPLGLAEFFPSRVRGFIVEVFR